MRRYQESGVVVGMAEKRMFTKKIVDSDAFLDMGLSAQALYFHLAMRADDEGFINNPKKIQRMIGASDDDMKLLIAKKFILVFDSGIIVIKHWRMHNYIQSDRFHPTDYREERSQLMVKDNKAYSLIKNAGNVEISTMYPECIQDVSKMLPENRLDIDKNRLDIDLYGEFKNVKLKKDEFEKLKEKFPKDYMARIEALSEYMKSKGKQYKSHYATILSWARKEERDKPKVAEPKKYKVFEKEDYERDDFKAESMPQELREKLGGMFNAG